MGQDQDDVPLIKVVQKTVDQDEVEATFRGCGKGPHAGNQEIAPVTANAHLGCDAR